MTLEEFVRISEVSENTVKSWIKQGLVNGATVDLEGNYSISDLARPPYTQARAKDARAIRKSIIRGCVKRCSVNTKVFKIPEEEFQVYISDLISAGLITKKEVDGTTYYYSTKKADDSSENTWMKILKTVTGTLVEKAAKGATEAVIEKATGV